MKHRILLAFLCFSAFTAFSQTLPTPTASYHFDGDFREAHGLFEGDARGVTFNSDNRGTPLSAAQLSPVNSRIRLQQYSVDDQTQMTISCLVSTLAEMQHSPFIYFGISDRSGFGLALKHAGLQVPGNNPVLLTGGVYETTDTTIHIHANQWHHFVLVKDGMTYTVYLDGQQIMHRSQSMNAATDTMRIGADQIHLNRWGESLNALMDEVNIYNEALSASQVHDLFRADSSLGNYHALGVVRGKVYLDENGNCTQDALESGVQHNSVVITPGNQVYPLRADGSFTAYLSTGQTYSATLLDQSFIRVDSICATTGMLVNAGDSARISLGIQGRACAKLNVSLAASRRRRCFGNSTVVTVTNEGLGAGTTSRLRLTYPDGIVMTDARGTVFSTPSAGIYETDVPALAAGASHTIWLTDSVACRDSLRNQVLCQKAALLQAMDCHTPSPGWDGAVLKVTSRCDLGVSSIFKVENEGLAMTDSTEYRFFAADGLVSRGKLKLAAGDSVVFRLTDLNLTWIMEVDQTPDSDMPMASGMSQPCFLGAPPAGNDFLTRVSIPDSGLSFAEECLMVLDSYDPNDKEVSPKGFGPTGIVEPGTKLSYKINFQNEGTASTEFISISDTLSADLDLSTFERGSESHEGATLIQYYLQDGRSVVRYRWNALNLVPKSVSNIGSQGFVSFSIKAKPNRALGTIVANKASIYFDYNPPVVTPIASVTLNHVPAPTQPVTPPVVTAAKEKLFAQVRLYPNPASSIMTVTGLKAGAQSIQILDAAGKVALVVPISSNVVDIPVAGLQPGYYLVQVQGNSTSKAMSFVKQ